MKKFVALTLALGFSGAAMANSDLFYGDGTYHVVKESKPSSLTRAEVVSKTDSTNLANALDASVSPSVPANPMLSRAEVIRKMEGFQYADFGDATNPTPWAKT
jgi:sulfur relay (sulfurtransferase) DsrF/TusC family protein